MEPTSGPQKSFSHLELTGCGFWDSGNIIVRFTSIGGSAFAAPRSCPGKLITSSLISCRPPRLGSAGTYEVSISMDGKVFLADVVTLSIYKDITLSTLTPQIIDTRRITSCQFSVVRQNFAACSLLSLFFFHPHPPPPFSFLLISFCLSLSAFLSL